MLLELIHLVCILHLSSNYEYVKAKKEGIKIISITDHDTVLGNKNITLTKEEKLGITIVPGIEL